MNGAPPPQRIPRPASAQPGPPAPWAALEADRRSGLDVASVTALLARPIDALPLDVLPVGMPRQSAVLAALFDEKGEARVLLTRRSPALRSHQSEVSFPGGRVEDGESLADAALRETWEEVGVPPETVTLIGTLSPLMTFSSAALITPFVGVLPGRPALRVNAAEVARAFDVALADLLQPGVYHSERWDFGQLRAPSRPATAGAGVWAGPEGGSSARVLHFFELPGDIVWGATGRMLWELLARVTGTVPEPSPEDGPLP